MKASKEQCSFRISLSYYHMYFIRIAQFDFALNICVMVLSEKVRQEVAENVLIANESLMSGLRLIKD